MNDPKDPGIYCSLCTMCNKPLLTMTGRSSYGFGIYKCLWCINDVALWKKYKRLQVKKLHYASQHDCRITRNLPRNNYNYNTESWFQRSIIDYIK